jgi:hypothetical protein
VEHPRVLEHNAVTTPATVISAARVEGTTAPARRSWSLKLAGVWIVILVALEIVVR